MPIKMLKKKKDGRTQLSAEGRWWSALVAVGGGSSALRNSNRIKFL